MIEDGILDGMLEAPNVNDVVRLVREVRRQRREIAWLRGGLSRIGTGIQHGQGPLWVEEQAELSLAKDFRLE